MLIDELKQKMFAAMKAKNTIEKEILRTAIGDITSTGADADDARVLSVLKKLIKSNEETLKATSDSDQQDQLKQEIAVLAEFVPQTMSVEQITEALGEVTDQIRAAGNDGQATGVAMKHLKAQGADVEGKNVSAAVKQLRA